MRTTDRTDAERTECRYVALCPDCGEEVEFDGKYQDEIGVCGCNGREWKESITHGIYTSRPGFRKGSHGAAAHSQLDIDDPHTDDE